MPHYFFDIECMDLVLNRFSADLPDEYTARQYALGLANTILGKPHGGEGAAPWRVKIAEEGSKRTYVVTSASDTLNKDKAS